MSDPSKTTYGERSPHAPLELDVFAFLIGKWDGRGKTTLQDGTVAEFPVTWIGRDILDGTAIADEIHASPGSRSASTITSRTKTTSAIAWTCPMMAGRAGARGRSK